MNDNSTINSLVGRDIPQVSLDELIYGGYTSSSFKSPYETKAKNIAKTVQDLTALEAQGKLTARGKTKLMLAQSKYDNALKDLEVDIQSRYGRFDAKRKAKQAKDLKSSYESEFKNVLKGYDSNDIQTERIQNYIYNFPIRNQPQSKEDIPKLLSKFRHGMSNLDVINITSRNTLIKTTKELNDIRKGRISAAKDAGEQWLADDVRVYRMQTKLLDLVKNPKYRGVEFQEWFKDIQKELKDKSPDPKAFVQYKPTEKEFNQAEEAFKYLNGAVFREGFDKNFEPEGYARNFFKYMGDFNKVFYGRDIASEEGLQAIGERFKQVSDYVDKSYSKESKLYKDRLTTDKLRDLKFAYAIDPDPNVNLKKIKGFFDDVLVLPVQVSEVNKHLSNWKDGEKLLETGETKKLEDSANMLEAFLSIPQAVRRKFAIKGKFPLLPNTRKWLRDSVVDYLNSDVGGAMLHERDAEFKDLDLNKPSAYFEKTKRPSQAKLLKKAVEEFKKSEHYYTEDGQVDQTSAAKLGQMGTDNIKESKEKNLKEFLIQFLADKFMTSLLNPDLNGG
tara:strand:- start:360 stop:2036 length:1677 start_codon:yes stop_codon:yes gene_type:complete